MTIVSLFMTRLRAAGLALVAGLVLPGCASLSPTPPVDILPTTPPAGGGASHTAARHGQPSTTRPATGPHSKTGARMVGDSVTIQIVENVTASQKSSSSVDRNSEVSAGITALPFVSKSFTDKTTLGAKSDNTFAGKGRHRKRQHLLGVDHGHRHRRAAQRAPGRRRRKTDRREPERGCAALLGHHRPAFPAARQHHQLHPGGQRARGVPRRGAQNEAQIMGWLGRFFLTILPF